VRVNENVELQIAIRNKYVRNRLFILQGLPVLPVLLDAKHTGDVFDNGTWTGVLGQLQSGIADMWAKKAYVALARSRSFLYTTPFTYEKYGALMERQVDKFYIDVNSLTAGVNMEIYAILCALLMSLIGVAYINERCYSSTEQNSIWHLLLSLFPQNGQMWPNQFGVTRKILLATSGFTILILSSLYQAKQAEELMVPYPPPKFTLEDIESLLSSERAKLLFYTDFALLDYVSNMSKILANSIPITHAGINVSETLSLMHNHNAIFISTESDVLNLLFNIEPELCKNYVYTTFDDWAQTMSAVIIRKERKDMLESMNVIVAERMSYVDDYIQSLTLNKKCREHLFPIYTSNPTYSSLKLPKLSGPFAFLVLFLCFAFIVFVIELLFVRWRKPLRKFHIVIRFNGRLPPDVQHLILVEHAKMQQLIANEN
jgi:hypothetical protein